MAGQDNSGMTNWERIQRGVSEIEKHIGQKRYNMAMVQSRQTLEFMVKCLCEKYDIEENALIDKIDALYDCGVISKTTCEHYHKIRTIGNKAIHEDDNSAYNANQAHHLLSQEVYAFSSELNSTKKRAKKEHADVGSRNAVAASKPSAKRAPAHRSKGGSSFDIGSLIKPLALVIIIIILLWVIKFLHTPSEKAEETTGEVVVEQTMEVPEETEAEEPEVLGIYKVTDALNVRPEPSTEKDRLGQLMPGTEVTVIRDYDDTWCVIEYKGQEAYIVKQYLEFVQ